MTDEKNQDGSDSLDELVRQAECCDVCGMVVEGRLCKKTNYLQVVTGKKCGCDEAVKRLVKKMGVSWVEPNDPDHLRKRS